MCENKFPHYPVWVRVPFMRPYWRIEEYWMIFKTLILRGKHRSALLKELHKEYLYEHITLLGTAREGILLACETLPKGSEVVLPSFICRTVAEAIVQAGCTVRFVDIDPDFDMSIDSIKKAINKKTSAVVLAHQYGKENYHTKDIVELCKKKKLMLISDYATMIPQYPVGDVVVISFNNGKPICSAGGGVLLTNDKKIIENLNLQSQSWIEEARKIFYTLTRHNWIKHTAPIHYFLNKIGVIKTEYDIPKLYESFRNEKIIIKHMNLSQIGLGYAQFKRRDEIIAINIFNGRYLYDRLQDCDMILPKLDSHQFTYFTILTEKRYELSQFLTEKGISCQWTFYPLHLQSQFKNYPKEKLIETEEIWKQTLSLPCTNLSNAQLQYVVDVIKEWDNGQRS